MKVKVFKENDETIYFVTHFGHDRNVGDIIKINDKIYIVNDIPSVNHFYIKPFNNDVSLLNNNSIIPTYNNIQFIYQDEEHEYIEKEQVNHPNHYNSYPIEVIDMMLDIWGIEKVIDFCYINAFKYRMRIGLKDDMEQDLKKEQWYINKAKELEKDLE